MRGGEQIDVCGYQTRGGVIIGLLDLRIPNASVRLARSHIVSGPIHDVEDIHRSRSRGTSAGPCAEVPCDNGPQTVSNRLIEVNSFGQGNVKVDFLRVTGRCGVLGGVG